MTATVQRAWIEIVLDEDPDPSYLEQKGFENRLEQYRNGLFNFVGVRACAEILVPFDGQSIGQVLKSPGLWGIEDDSPKHYLREIGEGEAATLRAILDELNVSTTGVVFES